MTKQITVSSFEQLKEYKTVILENLQKGKRFLKRHLWKRTHWSQVECLEEKLQFIERFLDEKGLLAEAAEYIENAMQNLEELPFD